MINKERNTGRIPDRICHERIASATSETILNPRRLDKLLVRRDHDIVLFCAWSSVRTLRGSKLDGHGAISSGAFLLSATSPGFRRNECLPGLPSKMRLDLPCRGCSGLELFGIACDNED